MLVLSGGVSAGVLDLVPATLQACGVEEVFHKIQLKPGKPLWFGVRRATPSTLVFGLPGNPVSSLVCFELFVRPALDALAGREVVPPELKAALAHPWQHRGGRPTYFPASLAEGRVTLLPWKGSADQRTLSEANCLCLLPAEPREFQAEDEVVVRLLG